MPSVEVVGTSPATPENLDRRLFKSHKSLPRRSNTVPDGYVAQVLLPDQNGHASNRLPYATAPVLPLTPPGVTQDESPTEADISKGIASSHSVAGVLTPSKLSHPPTPETTPPRGFASSYRPGLNQFGYASCSSRAESFQTACEMLSDADTETPRRSSQSLPQSTTQRKARVTDDSGRRDAKARETAAAADPPANPSKSSSLKNNEKSSRTPPHRKHLLDSTDLSNKFARDPLKRSRGINDVCVPDFEAPAQFGNSGDRIGRAPDIEHSVLSINQFQKQIGWPTSEDPLIPVESEDQRRFSGVSTSSTIEAMIIDAVRPAKRGLRHTEKRFSLRSTSSPITKSERLSLTSSTNSQRHLSHKAARITESDRRSIVSEMSISGSSTLGPAQQHVDVVPVVVIPERRSSLKASSSSTSRNPSQTRSRPPSRQAPTLPKSRPGSLDLPRQRKRTLSDPHASGAHGAELRGRGFGRPYIPPRRSSLSAPISQNNSRATSLTSESLRSHNLSIERQMENQLPELLRQVPVLEMHARDKLDASDISKTQSILIGVEDISHLRPPSVPYTQYSIPSSSPGPFEIDEATTVTFFPHNNKSILLVEPQVQSALQVQVPVMNQATNQDQPHTPEILLQPDADVDSPLRNPRPPPQPPVSKAAVPSPRDELDKAPHDQNVDPELNRGSSRRFESVRRAWVSRPRSESFNSFARSFSLTGAKNPKAGEDIDGKSQPFWRPRRFWDDSPGAETEAESPGEERPPPAQSTDTDQYISNSVGMPQRKVFFEGPPLPSRIPRPKQRLDGSSPYHSAARSTLVESRIFTPEALYSQTSLHQRQFPAVSWWRLRLRSGAIRTLRKRLRRSMQQRAEGRREARREKLKQSIGEAVLVNSSTQVQVRKPAT